MVKRVFEGIFIAAVGGAVAMVLYTALHAAFQQDKFGFIQVSTDVGGTLYIDDQRSAELSPLQKYTTGRLEAGAHRVRLERTDYQPASEVVYVSPNQTIAKQFSLARISPPIAHGPPTAILETTLGSITCTLFPDRAPITVENFIRLARGTRDWTDRVSHETKREVPFYDNTVFRGVFSGESQSIVELMAMPEGWWMLGYDTTPDSGYLFQLEPSGLHFDRPGRLAVGINGSESNGSVLLIGAVPHVESGPIPTIFGQCQDLNIIEEIASAARSNRPVRMTHIMIR